MMQSQEYFLKEHLRYKTLTILEDISHYNLIMHTALLAKSLKGGFRPDQARVPAGQSNGGQWVSEGGGGSGGIVPQKPKLPAGTGIIPTPSKPSDGVIVEFPRQKPDGVIMNLVDGNNQQNPIYQGEPDLPLESVYPLETLLALGGAFGALRGLVGALTRLFGEVAVGGAADIGDGATVGASEDALSLPKPKGIPDDWEAVAANDGRGVKYLDPADPKGGTYVRTSMGNRNSQFPHSQKPYVRWQVNGRSLDAYGNPVLRDSAESHIPLTDFKFNPKVFK